MTPAAERTYATLSDLLRSPPAKAKCGRDGCPSTTYDNGDHFLCVCCDDEMFEPCIRCSNLKGWCTCDGADRSPVKIEEKAKSVKVKMLEVLLKRDPKPVRTREFAELVGCTEMYVAKMLKELWDDELIRKPKHGHWRLAV